MASKFLKSFLCAVGAVLATSLDPVSVQAQNTNTTIQQGQINTNDTYQQGASNTNTTSQTGMININRTIQRDGDGVFLTKTAATSTSNSTGPFGRLNPSEMKPGKGFQGVSLDRGHTTPDRVQRSGSRQPAAVTRSPDAAHLGSTKYTRVSDRPPRQPQVQ